MLEYIWNIWVFGWLMIAVGIVLTAIYAWIIGE